MQYPLILRSKWKTHRRYKKKIQSQNVQISGYVYQNTNGPNYGPVWKIQLFLLSEICTRILLAGQMWERQFEKVLLEQGWEKVPNWECLVVNQEKGTILVCMWTIQVFVKTLFVSDGV